MVLYLKSIAATELNNVVQGRVLLLPIASIESHGPLPLGTDLMICECITSRLSDSVVVAPPIPFSTSIEHAFQSFAVYVMSEIMVSYLKQILSALATLRRPIVVVPFHGGVRGVAYHAAREAMFSVRSVRIVMFDPFHVIEEVLRERGFRGIVHADHVEASMLLACGYSIPSIERCTEIYEDRSAPFEPWIGDDIAHRYTRESVCGDEALGKELISKIVDEIESLVARLIEVYG